MMTWRERQARRRRLPDPWRFLVEVLVAAAGLAFTLAAALAWVLILAAYLTPAP